MAHSLTAIRNWIRSFGTFRIRSDIIGDDRSKMNLAWLKKYEIPFEDKYVFKFIEKPQRLRMILSAVSAGPKPR
jgi:hypothetical protein